MVFEDGVGDLLSTITFVIYVWVLHTRWITSASA